MEQKALYSIIRSILFRFDPEVTHAASLALLDVAYRLGFLRGIKNERTCVPHKVLGLEFPNSVGLAAGFDKNAEHIDALSKLGFGFIEVGTVTPRPQRGNQKPRLFRIPAAQAIVNRMGFNNHGVEQLVKNIKRAKYRGILGVSIGKNADTPIEKAVDDYLFSFDKVYDYASYVALNISSPGTPNLRQLQRKNDLSELLSKLKLKQHKLAEIHGKYVPLVVKIAPDLTPDEVQDIAETLIEHNIDGVIATNSTLSREGVESMENSTEKGGLSGAPLCKKATTIVRQLNDELGEKIPIIASGGIMTMEDAQEKFNAGASLVQIYSGLIYSGPKLVRNILATTSYEK